MTLQQLRYAVVTAEKKTISEAAASLYLAQPSLTKALKELEKEMGITIFTRTNRGVAVSKEGEVFLGYARQVLEQAALIEEKYLAHTGEKQEFCVSTQHYSFAVNAFVSLIRACGREHYDFRLRETQTYEILEDVAKMKSEIGILYLNPFNEAVLRKLMRAQELEFTELFVAKPHVFLSSRHPLSQKSEVTMAELQPYPYLSFEQGEHNSFYYSEEIFSTENRPKNIRVRDRATLFNLLIGLDGYTVCSGVIDEELNGKDIKGMTVAVSGSGNVAIYATQKAQELGAKVVTVSDSTGWVYDPEGIDVAALKEIKEVKRARLTEYKNYRPNSEYHEGRGVWSVKVDLALPCATQNELHLEDAKQLVANGCVAVCEGANMPTTYEATEYLQENGVIFAPGKAANAGGVATSALEMSQNSERLSWTFEEVDAKLKNIMVNICHNMVDAAKRYDMEGNYVAGANIAGFEKVVDAMTAQGIV